MIKTIVGSFDSFEEASSVARDLRAAGFLDNDVNIVANNAKGEFLKDTTDTATSRATHDTTSGAATGALTGGAIGGAAGLAVSLMGLAIPGVGPILAAGPIAAALAGAGAGAVAGGLIGGLTDLGVSEEDAQYYAESVRRGGALVTVRADESRADEAAAIMRRHGAIDLEDRVEQWKSSGWKGYDPEAQPFTYEDIERDRSMYGTGRSASTGLGAGGTDAGARR
jgi:uncharacterized membrane protein